MDFCQQSFLVPYSKYEQRTKNLSYISGKPLSLKAVVKAIILIIKSFGIESTVLEYWAHWKNDWKSSSDKKIITIFITDNSHIEECDILVAKSILLSQTPDWDRITHLLTGSTEKAGFAAKGGLSLSFRKHLWYEGRKHSKSFLA